MAEKPSPMPQNVPFPEFTIALETAPEHRWDEIVDKFYDYDIELVYVQMTHVIPSLAGLVSKWVNPWALEHFGEYGQEIMGAVKAIKAKFPQTILTESNLLILNLLYSFDASCTSAVADSAEGVIHGRNMDFGFANALRTISMNITYTKNGKPLYKGTSFLGYSGILTGMRFDGFGISVDARHKDDSLAGNLLRIAMGYKPPSWLVRETLENVTNFDDARKTLSETKMAASMYMILSGTEAGQGTVLTRKPSGLVDDWPLDSAKGAWWRLETNYDHWEAPPTYDDRRTLGNKHFEDIGQDKITKDTMFDGVFSEIPNLRKVTVYTTIMCPKDNTYETHMW
eukprot:CAMPEP_0115029776 /NCGR_PEP_ID=MMETSP0216-20121206/37251_1 /TAXON_ID=223996 /ORGANISM="Protocruzia adherens, Strain Boccale" /LENGTH=339 /DNA_ID=CAMNT_0002406523 /DNA_START=80 /DNA_END=1096 /DNA_ORIENTATION=-